METEIFMRLLGTKMQIIYHYLANTHFKHIMKTNKHDTIRNRYQIFINNFKSCSFYLYIFLLLTLKTWVCYIVRSTILFLNFLSIIFTLQAVTFILLRSSSKWSIQNILFLLTGLVPYCFHSIIFLVVFVLAIQITWATHYFLCDF